MSIRSSFLSLDIRYTNFDATSGLQRFHGKDAAHVLSKLIEWIEQNRNEHTPVLIVRIEVV